MWKKTWSIIKSVIFIVPTILSAAYYVFFIRGKPNMVNTTRDARIGELDRDVREGSDTVKTGLRDSIETVDSLVDSTDKTTDRLSRARAILAKARERTGNNK